MRVVQGIGIQDSQLLRHDLRALASTPDTRTAPAHGPSQLSHLTLPMHTF